jgi:ubiquinone/menaquinone biosynthesis C-methylase UbiE
VVLTGARSRVAQLGWDVHAQPWEAVESCNLCSGRQFVTLTHEDRYGFAVASAACTDCGLVFLDPHPTADAYDAFYRDTYRPLVSAFHGRVIDAASVEVEQAEYARALAELLEPSLEGRRGGALLDVGGSTGVVAEVVCSAYGLDGTVLDPAPDELIRAADRGLATVPGTIESFEPEASGFDVVLLCQTLDHVLDASGALAKLRSVLADDGILFVDVVDFRAAYLRGWSVEGATKVDHPYSFTEPTIEAMLARSGLTVVRKDYAADHLHVGYVCRPGPAGDSLPPAGSVTQLLREIRYVQNTPASR